VYAALSYLTQGADTASARVHVIANLPASAPEFMDAFAGVFSEGAAREGFFLLVHLAFAAASADVC
jgi:hypothetical protein